MNGDSVDDVRSIVDQLVTLRRAALRRYPEYAVESDEATAALSKEAEAAVAGGDEVRILDDRAALVLWRAPTALGWEAQRGRIELADDDEEAVCWLAEQLQEIAPRLEPSLELLLDAAHAGVLPHAEAVGLRPRLILLHGSPRGALEGLQRGGLDRSALAGLEIAPLEVEHIEPIVALSREVFGERPEHGMLPPGISLTPAVQEGLDAFVRKMQGGCVETGTGFVVLRDGEVLGQGSAHTRHDPLLGQVGGLGIALRPEIRGRGVGKLLYETLLKRLMDMEVKVMRGRSANPTVLHLAQRMGRSLRAWQLELGPPPADRC